MPVLVDYRTTVQGDERVFLLLQSWERGRRAQGAVAHSQPN
jgi:hypothetical protein